MRALMGPWLPTDRDSFLRAEMSTCCITKSRDARVVSTIRIVRRKGEARCSASCPTRPCSYKSKQTVYQRPERDGFGTLRRQTSGSCGKSSKPIRWQVHCMRTVRAQVSRCLQLPMHERTWEKTTFCSEGSPVIHQPACRNGHHEGRVHVWAEQINFFFSSTISHSVHQFARHRSPQTRAQMPLIDVRSNCLRAALCGEAEIDARYDQQRQ